MPTSKVKPSELAAEAKRRYIPYCETNYPQFSPRSVLYSTAPVISQSRPPVLNDAIDYGLRVAVIEGDPVDVAFDWYDFEVNSKREKIGSKNDQVSRIPVVNAANEKKPGGDWELGLIASEENICRRSNLVRCLGMSENRQGESAYPIPIYGGIYSPHVIVFRHGVEGAFAVWPEFRSIPVISVSPSRRPKLDESGERYSFEDESNHVRNKVRSILRIAADQGHRDVVVGPWGLGQVYRNPPRELAKMWNDILFHEPEFENRFSNIVFAIDSHRFGDGDKGTPGMSGLNELQIFKEELNASNVHKEGFLRRMQQGE